MLAIINTAEDPQFADSYCFATVMCGTTWSTECESERSMGYASDGHYNKYYIFRKWAPSLDLWRVPARLSYMPCVISKFLASLT